MRSRPVDHLVVAVTVVAIALLVAPPATAAIPENDDWQHAMVVTDLPFTTSQDTTDATSQVISTCGSVKNVWFAFTATRSMAVRVDTIGSDYDTELGIYVLTYGYPQLIQCATDMPTNPQSEATIRVEPGSTYLISAGGWDSGGQLILNMREVPIPDNDDLADATVITSLPFEEEVDIAAASTEPTDPIPSCEGTVDHTVWYALTPSQDMHLTVDLSGSYSAVVGVYRGTVGSFVEAACKASAGRTSFFVLGGEPFLIEIGNGAGTPSSVTLRLQDAPQPVARIGVDDTCASPTADTWLASQSSDPGGMRFVREAWDFGDGTTSEGPDVSHRYPADGSYAVTLDVETSDGRMATTATTVVVRTHDVSVTWIETPPTAKNRQTKTIAVDVRNMRYDEGVTVTLFVSVPGGYLEVARQWQSIPVGTTTTFKIPYTFSRQESIKRIATFIAVATLDVCSDNSSDDNQMTSAPVKVIG